MDIIYALEGNYHIVKYKVILRREINASLHKWNNPISIINYDEY